MDIEKRNGSLPELPDDLKDAYGNVEYAHQYVEDVDSQDVILPRIQLLQSLSPQVQDGTFKPGQVTLSTDDSVVFISNPKDTFYFVPCFRWKERALFPQERGKPPVCRASDFRTGIGNPGGKCSECPMSQFVDNMPPKCSLFINFIGLAYHRPSKAYLEAILSCWSTKLAFAKRLTTEILKRASDAPWTRIYQIGVNQTENPKGRFWVFTLQKWPNNQYAEIIKNIDILRKARKTAEGARSFRAAGKLQVDLSMPGDEVDDSFDFGANESISNEVESEGGMSADDPF